MFTTNADSEADEQETREEIIAEHDRLLEEYNRTISRNYWSRSPFWKWRSWPANPT